MIKSVLRLLMCAAFGLMVAGAYAEDAPQWVKRGVKSLNEQRSNDTYTFVSINYPSFNMYELKEHPDFLLKKYITDTYSVKPGTLEISETSPAPEPVYRITFKGLDNYDYEIRAKLVDEYSKLDDYEINTYQFEFYQLFAMSKPNVAPDFDKFTLTQKYNALPMAMSLIPGMGQINKGQYTKGYVILGSEIGFAGATLIFDKLRRDARKEWKKHGYAAGSWKSKEQAWQNFEIGAVSCFGAIYIYNLIDAAVSKGARKVKVEKATGASVQVVPFIDPDFTGMTMVVNF